MLGIFQIPKEGPMSLKGGISAAKAFNRSVLIATNFLGNTQVYKGDSLFTSFKLDMSHLDSSGYFSMPMRGNALHQISDR